MEARAKLEFERHNAKEYRRRLMQGLGRPIISFESNGYRVVAVGNQLRWGKTWKTFFDFLGDYIKTSLTPDWGNAELKKPLEQRHPLIQWYHMLCTFQRAAIPNKNGIYDARMTGAVKAYFSLAYDLYLSAHNAKLQDLLLKRLRNPATFEGALYEAHVIGCFAKAGFEIDFEDEGDSNTTHCEFTAKHPETGQVFSVEAKAVTSQSSRAGSSAVPPKIGSKLHSALVKKAKGKRVVFIEMNRADPTRAGEVPSWEKTVTQELRQLEVELTIEGQPAPEAYVFLTNRGFMHALQGTEFVEFGIVEGFKIDDFPGGKKPATIRELRQARDKHIEMHWLAKALEQHQEIPAGFDDRTPAEAFAEEPVERVRIGDVLLAKDEAGKDVPGVLESAIVMENDKHIFGTFHLQDGRRVHNTIPMSDTELAIYKASPSTFFEVIERASRGLKTPLDYYDFLAKTYMKASKEDLLSWMAAMPGFDPEMFKDWTQQQLAEFYCEGMATSMWQSASQTPPDVRGNDEEEAVGRDEAA